MAFGGMTLKAPEVAIAALRCSIGRGSVAVLSLLRSDSLINLVPFPVYLTHLYGPFFYVA